MTMWFGFITADLAEKGVIYRLPSVYFPPPTRRFEGK